MTFKETNINELKLNPFSLIGNEWLLVTAGNEEGANTMTASWGSLGVFWSKNVATIYIRSTRYTNKFLEKYDAFSLSFFDSKYRDILKFCGSVSGRNINKVEMASLTPKYDENTTYFEEAKMVMICRKLCYYEMLPSGFHDPRYDNAIYPGKDYHTLYMGEILKVLIK